ncbi:MAG: hypothetical protein ACFB15_24395 [Cyclobacteriaceae bacterium]
MLSWYLVPHVWTADLSKGKLKNPKGLEQYVVVGLTILLMFGGPVMLSYQLVEKFEVNYWGCFAASFFVQFTIFVVDVLFIDWFIYMVLKPKFMEIEGIERADDLWYHTKEGLGGLVVGIPASALAAGIGFWLAL